ncbi:MAG: 2'-5' RNA ligase family protein, partial [Bacillaceae bacterium]
KENYRPHLTLAAYPTLDLEAYFAELELYSKNRFEIPACLSTLGTFLKSSVLFLAPKPSLQLLNFHQDYHQTFSHYHCDSNSLYLPKNWIPHCTIANHLTEEQYTNTLTYCHHNIKPINATINRLSIIQLNGSAENNRQIPTLHTVNLKSCNNSDKYDF